MNENEVQYILESTGALKTNGHYVCTGGGHTEVYVDKYEAWPYTTDVRYLCDELARRFRNDGIESVIAPAVGGIVLSTRIAEHLTGITGIEVMALHADKELDGSFSIKQQWRKHVRGKRVLLIEDTLNTGVSVKGVIRAIDECDGDVVAIGVIVNRGNARDVLFRSYRFEALLTLNMKMWTLEACRRDGPCSRGVLINVRVGHGAKFLEER